MFLKNAISRRKFITLAAGVGIAAGCSRTKPEPGTTFEFLVQQHGILRRAISVLEEMKGGMDARMDLDPEIIRQTVEIVRIVMVEFHQKLEEKHIFPVFESANKMNGMISVLREQHEAGTQMAAILGQLASGFSARDLEQRRTMQNAIHHFNRMYRAHADREDTLVFPLIHRIIPADQLGKLNDAFRSDERRIMGQNGFDDAVGKVGGLENALGIGDLAGFTPKIDELR